MSKLKSFKTQVPKVRRANPAMNIIRDAILYLVASDPLLSKRVSAAKELVGIILFCVVFFRDDENIFFFET